jgi:hypothetical protein
MRVPRQKFMRATVGIVILVTAVLCVALLSGCVGPRKETGRVSGQNPAWRPPPPATASRH